MEKKILVIKRFSWCEGCGEHTEQTKTPEGFWDCPCGALLYANGHRIAEYKPREVEKVAVTCPA